MKKKLRSAFDPRQYMLSRDFEFYYYSDKDFHTVGLHSHDYYELYFFVEGDVETQVEDKRYKLVPGDVLIVPPGKKHMTTILAPSVYRRFVMWLSADYIERLESDCGDYTWLIRYAEKKGEHRFNFGAAGFSALTARLVSLLEEIKSERFGKDAAVVLGVGDIMLHLSRLGYEMMSPKIRRRNESYYSAITRFIDNHIEEDLSLERLSREFFISKYYISHLFREEIGISVHSYIIKKRLSTCADAITAGESVTRAYTMCGFKDYSSFYRAFRKEFGVSPSEYAAGEGSV